MPAIKKSILKTLPSLHWTVSIKNIQIKFHIPCKAIRMSCHRENSRLHFMVVTTGIPLFMVTGY